jgi:hypothetical protein
MEHELGLDSRFATGGFYGQAIYLAERATYSIGGRYVRSAGLVLRPTMHGACGVHGAGMHTAWRGRTAGACSWWWYARPWERSRCVRRPSGVKVRARWRCERWSAVLVGKTLGLGQELGKTINAETRAMKMPAKRVQAPMPARYNSVQARCRWRPPRSDCRGRCDRAAGRAAAARRCRWQEVRRIGVGSAECAAAHSCEWCGVNAKRSRTETSTAPEQRPASCL